MGSNENHRDLTGWEIFCKEVPFPVILIMAIISTLFFLNSFEKAYYFGAEKPIVQPEHWNGVQK